MLIILLFLLVLFITNKCYFKDLEKCDTQPDNYSDRLEFRTWYRPIPILCSNSCACVLAFWLYHILRSRKRLLCLHSLI